MTRDTIGEKWKCPEMVVTVREVSLLNPKKNQVWEFTLPEIVSSHLKMDGLEYFLVSFWDAAHFFQGLLSLVTGKL